MNSLRSDYVNQFVCPLVPVFRFYNLEAFEANFDVLMFLVFHQSFTSVSPVFHQRFTSVLPVLHQCFTSVSPVFHKCFTSVSQMFLQCFTSFS